MSGTDPVIPISPDVVPLGTDAQVLAEKAVRDFARFMEKTGEQPRGYALVIIGAEKTTEPYYQTLEGSAGWRGFLALAGAMLTEQALKPD